MTAYKIFHEGTSVKKSQNQTGSAHVVIIVILVLAIMGLLGFVFWQNFIQKKATTTTSTTTTVVDQYSGWNTYNNSTYGFSLRYPANWIAGKVDNNSSSIQLVSSFESPVKVLSSSPSPVGSVNVPEASVTISTQKISKVSLSTGEVLGSVYGLLQGQSGKDTSSIFQNKYNETINSIPVTEFDMLAQEPYFAVLFTRADSYVELSFSRTPTKASLNETTSKILASLKLN